MNNKVLIEKAKKLLDNSYSPYSKFRVAAIAIDEKGNEYSGVNVENASYGATICAERNAMFSGISHGSGNFKKLVVISDSESVTMPCGICLQVINELCDKETEIICCNRNGDYKVYGIKDLLPIPFE
jgi:cytidine deaminase